MSLLKDCSEIREAARLLRELAAEMGPAADRLGATGAPGRFAGRLGSTEPSDSAAMPVPAVLPAGAPAPSTALDAGGDSPFRGEQLARLVGSMCRRGGFSGAILADASGLALVAHNSPVEDDRLAAFTAVLGDALEKAGRFLSQPGADYISLDVSYSDKAVLRRFAFGELHFFLMVLCPQGVDTRGEIELCVKGLITALQ